MGAKQLFIGIEGVSMRTSVAVLAEADGTILSAARIPDPITLHTTPRDLLRARLNQLLNKVLQNAGHSLRDLKDCTVCIGMSGVTFTHDREVVLPNLFRQFKLQATLICTGDAEIAFASHTRQSHGSAIICMAAIHRGIASLNFIFRSAS